MAQTIRCGIYFKDAPSGMYLETLARRIGRTIKDDSPGPQRNRQTYWFPSKEAFDAEIANIIESIVPGTLFYPIPVFQVIEQPADVVIPAPARRPVGRPRKHQSASLQPA
jgi:hypothetical protein